MTEFNPKIHITKFQVIRILLPSLGGLNSEENAKLHAKESNLYGFYRAMK